MTAEPEDVAATVDVALCAMPVVDVTADAGVNQVRVSWLPGEVPAVEEDGVQPFGPADEYLVRVSGETERLVRSADTSATVSGLKNGVEYGFEVFALTAGGRSEGSGQVNATPSTGMEGVVAGLIVEFEPGSEQALGSTDVPGEDRVGEVELTVAEQVSDDAVLVELSEPVDLDTAEQIAADLAADEQVAWAEPDEFFFTSSADDWNLTGAYGVDAFAEPDATRAGEGAGSTVAVIDTGITNHPDLESRLVSGYDFVSSPEQLMASRAPNAPPVAFDGDYVDEATYGATGRDANPTDPGDWRDIAPTRTSSWHGTQIAGVVGAVAPGASIQPVRALSWRGGLLSDIAAGITWASGGTVDGVPANTNPSKVINMSFSVQTTCPFALQDAIDGARERGSVLIAAAGNASDDAGKFAPGNCNGVITVGSTTSEGTRADYSNYGPAIDISAPGGNTTTPVSVTSNTGTTTPDQPTRAGDFGTSVSASHVAAGAAILASTNPSITPDEAYTTLTGRDFTKAFAGPACDTANPDYTCGTGILSLAQIATVASGDQDYAMRFNGTNQYATTSAISLGGTSEATIEIWVKPMSTCSSEQFVIRQEHGYYLSCSGGEWGFGFKSQSNPSNQYNWVTKATNVPIQQGDWQHIAVTRSSAGLLQFFMNGQVAYSTTDTLPWWDQVSEPVSVGANLFLGPSSFFNGELDELRLYDTDQSASIATQMHEYGPTSLSGLLAYYDFNEGPAGTTGPGTVYNRADGATSATNLRTVNSPTYTDIKQTTSN
ncbi:MAG: S8 family serine peptidase, partial [Actinomycetota bacterium]|nr:S8 family serine peptidase [Actinomycetota bacterium]